MQDEDSAVRESPAKFDLLAPGPLSWRATWYPRAALAAICLVFAAFVAFSSGADAPVGRLGQDFPAFYAAGEIVVDSPADLYDIGVQREAQLGYFSTNDPGLLYFAYPPYTAVAYVPFTLLDFSLAYVVHSFAMVVALAGGLALLRPVFPVVDRRYETMFIASLLFYPMVRAVFGGQNTALTFLLLAAAVRAQFDNRDELTGVALALLLFKPHFSLPFLGLALLARRWRILLPAGFIGMGLYLVGALLQGVDWILPWFEQVQWFGREDTVVNGDIGISFPMVAESLVGIDLLAGKAAGWMLAVGCQITVLLLWWKGADLPLRVKVAASIPALILGSPHTVFYDAGLLVFALLLLAEDLPSRWKGILACAVLTIAHPISSRVGFTPVWLVTMGVLVWTLSAEVRPRLPQVRMIRVRT